MPRSASILAVLTFLLLPFCSLYAGSRLDQVVSPASMDRELLAGAVLDETNRAREANGRNAVEWLDPLGVAAGDHAKAMTRYGFFDHKNTFDPQQRTLGDRLSRAGVQTPAAAENIAMTFTTDFDAMREWMRHGGKDGPRPGARQHTYRTLAHSLVQQWMNSPGHRKNILNSNLTYVGLGFATLRDAKGLDRIYCVQNFCAPQRSVAMNRRFVSAL